MDSVLCALDFTEASSSVLKTAVDLAKRLKTQLIVLYAYRILPGNEAISDYRKTIVRKAQENFALLEKKVGLNGSVPYEFRAEVGFLTDRIQRAVQAHPMSVVVLGNQLAMESNEQKGMTLEEFVGQVSVPVMIVPLQ
jgi:nucleotide-binding universal stress UspA family protein